VFHCGSDVAAGVLRLDSWYGRFHSPVYPAAAHWYGACPSICIGFRPPSAVLDHLLADDVRVFGVSFLGPAIIYVIARGLPAMMSVGARLGLFFFFFFFVGPRLRLSSGSRCLS